jgi:protein-disulfide isomerase
MGPGASCVPRAGCDNRGSSSGIDHESASFRGSARDGDGLSVRRIAVAQGTAIALAPGMAMASQLVLPVTLGRDHLRGSRNGPVTLVEYGDYECRHCGIASAFVDVVRLRTNDDLRFAFRHFPVSASHAHARRAAEATEAAAAQGRFWAMHDLVFENQRALEDGDLLLYAAEIGLDVARFARELASARYGSRVSEDCVSGLESGVIRTPTFFINNARHVGAYDVDSLIRAIERARSRLVSRPPASGAPT